MPVPDEAQPRERAGVRLRPRELRLPWRRPVPVHERPERQQGQRQVPRRAQRAAKSAV